jgi:hypothetical protein
VVEGLASRPVCFLPRVPTLIFSPLSIGILVVWVITGRSFPLSGVAEILEVGTASLQDTLDGTKERTVISNKYVY